MASPQAVQFIGGPLNGQIQQLRHPETEHKIPRAALNALGEPTDTIEIHIYKPHAIRCKCGEYFYVMVWDGATI